MTSMGAVAQAQALAGLAQWPVSPVDHAMQQWWLQTDDACSSADDTLAVAFSGGADSTAVLLAAVRVCLQATYHRQGKKPPRRIVALHIHHGLQVAADAFEEHAQYTCDAIAQALGQMAGIAPLHGAQQLPPSGACPQTMRPLELVCQSRRIQVTHGSGQSLEAQARTARYAALADMAKTAGACAVLLGHHADDQAESVLLALSRGAGVAGLAGMAPSFERHGVRFARPLLALPGHTIRHWLQYHHVPCMEDPSNADLRFTRNRLRHALMPQIAQTMPGFQSSFARSARLAAEADALLRDLAADDLAHIGNPPAIHLLQQLGRPRQANALRHWLKSCHGVIGSEAQMQALLDVIAACTTRGHHIHIKVGQGYVQRAGRHLRWQLVE